MIIDFAVSNYRSVKELQTLNFVAAPIKSKYSDLDVNNVIPISEKLTLLKSIAIYGANGSGKSNLIKAMISMLVFIRDSFKNDELGVILAEPFLLDENSAKEPTFFQLSFIFNEVKYRYGFELIKNDVVSEWLFGTPEKKEVYYFTREKDNIKVNDKQFPEGKSLEDKTSSTSLFLSVTKAFNGKLSKAIMDFFLDKISISAGVTDESFRENTLVFLKDNITKQKIINLLNEADFGISDIKHHILAREDLPENSPKELLRHIDEGQVEFIGSKRDVLDENGNVVDHTYFNFDDKESEGTRKLFNYSGAIIEALEIGGVLVMDEFDARLHPLLTKKMVEMFNSSILNKNGAQLVFVTHDTNLLDNSLLRRDQIYFTEKNSCSETELYSLIDFKGVRNDASYEKDYIKGKYGAIPFLGNFKKLLS
jgi:AAA15 family ATPase/GTPase